MKCSSKNRFLTLKSLLCHWTGRFFSEVLIKSVYMRRRKHLQSHSQGSSSNSLDSDTDGKNLPIPPLQGSKLQRLWFSTNGRLAFAWFSSPGNLHRVKIWDMIDTNNNGVLKLQIVSSFPSTPIVVLTMQ
jgi:hypothetical protein